MNDQAHGSNDGTAKRGGAASDRGGCVVIALVFLVLPAVGMAFVVLWLNGNVLGWQTERDLASFYGAVGRGDYAAASGVATATDDAAIRAWAGIAAGGHGPATVISTVAYNFRPNFGENGLYFYTVHYRDGTEEHGLLARSRGVPFPLPPHTVEQGIRRCHDLTAPGERLEFGAIQQGNDHWLVQYVVVQQTGARVPFKAYASSGRIAAFALAPDEPQMLQTPVAYSCSR